jgi:hypothetical protein
LRKFHHAGDGSPAGDVAKGEFGIAGNIFLEIRRDRANPDIRAAGNPKRDDHFDSLTFIIRGCPARRPANANVSAEKMSHRPIDRLVLKRNFFMAPPSKRFLSLTVLALFSQERKSRSRRSRKLQADMLLAPQAVLKR